MADYTPAEVSPGKLKKKDDDMSLHLKKTRDIAADLGKIKKPTQILVGFALETDNEETNALGKMERKNLDMIVLNSLRDKGAGFACDTNKITIYRRDGEVRRFDLKSKSLVAADIVDETVSLLVEAERRSR